MIKISRIYLVLVPFLAFIIGFGAGHSHYVYYIPIWAIHACLMVAAAWVLGAHAVKSPEADKKHLVVLSIFMAAPWLFFSIFAGMGPPPSTMRGWVDTAREQEIRYFILIFGGVLLGIGSVLLKDYLQRSGDRVYSGIGGAALVIAIPLFIVNMAYWGSYLTESFRIFVASDAPSKRPDWYTTSRELFFTISVAEIGLMYLATAFFALSLRRVGLIGRGGLRAYVILSGLGFVLNLLPPGLPEPLSTMTYLVSIPAVPFIMPYLMGVGLLKRAGEKKEALIRAS